MKTRYLDLPTFVTKDGSVIREMMHPNRHGNQNQSLAEASIPVGAKTLLHKHEKSEEIYLVLQGIGIMQLGKQTLELRQGDSVAIAPGTPHNVRNIGDQELKILCCCAPAYSHEDTVILEQGNE